MKKIIIMILVVTLMVMMISCSSDGESLNEDLKTQELADDTENLMSEEDKMRLDELSTTISDYEKKIELLQEELASVQENYDLVLVEIEDMKLEIDSMDKGINSQIYDEEEEAFKEYTYLLKATDNWKDQLKTSIDNHIDGHKGIIAELRLNVDLVQSELDLINQTIEKYENQEINSNEASEVEIETSLISFAVEEKKIDDLTEEYNELSSELSDLKSDNVFLEEKREFFISQIEDRKVLMELLSSDTFLEEVTTRNEVLAKELDIFINSMDDKSDKVFKEQTDMVDSLVDKLNALKENLEERAKVLQDFQNELD
ncbi:hypothetical protein EZV73_07480 [Acidaminobacter sp. JC074]|uniref:hypothetical protein n=1 Tax=Acidaminobacter sp. JC074 TaxID=2530199 RepID=UPI001F105578|nr:hypothetical protein [Acidaminobacter sp. JC074]MCH4887406.1 hypothetical protein [Acidaminobacter sp. JC074]